MPVTLDHWGRYKPGDNVSVRRLRGAFRILRLDGMPDGSTEVHLWGGLPGREMHRTVKATQLGPRKRSRI